MAQLSFDITSLSGYSKVALGEHKLTLVAKATGYYDSKPSEAVDFINGYDIGFNLTKCSQTTSITKADAFGSVTLTFAAETYFAMPSTILVSGATYTWTANIDGDVTKGKLVLTNATGAVTVQIAAYQNLFTITKSATNGTWTGATTVPLTGSSTITLTPSTNYKLPDTVTVTGCKSSWNKSTGVLTLSEPTGAVTVSATCPIITYTITNVLTNVNADSSNVYWIEITGTRTLKYTAADKWNLPDKVTVANATSTWNKSTGTLTLSKPTGNITVTAVGERETYHITPTLSHCTAVDGNPSTVEQYMTAKLTFKCDEHYQAPKYVTTSNAKATVTDNGDGTFTVTVYDAVGGVGLMVNAVAKTYSIKINITHGTYDGIESLTYGTTGTGTIDPDANYLIPSAVTATNVKATVDQSTGVITFSDITGDATVTIDCPEVSYTFTVNAPNCTYTPQYTTIHPSSSYTITFTANSGYVININNISVTNATITNRKQDSDTKATITVGSATGAVTLAATATRQYTVTKTITYGTLSGPTTILDGGSATYTLTANDNYSVPKSITVTGATLETYDFDDTETRSTATVKIKNPTANVVITVVCIPYYTFEVDAVNCTVTPLNGYIISDDTHVISVSGTDTGYTWFGDVTATNAAAVANTTNKTVSISKATGNVRVTITALTTNVSITANISNGTYSGATTIARYGNLTNMKITPSTNYKLPDSITVTNVGSYTYDKTTGAITITNAKNNVTITASCVLITYAITYDLTNCTITPKPSTIASGASLTCTIAPTSGYTMKDATITVTGATFTRTAKGTSAEIVISKATNAVTITATGIIPTLDTPTNLEISGSTLTFDAVANATSYEVFADGNSIGTYTP